MPSIITTKAERTAAFNAGYRHPAGKLAFCELALANRTPQLNWDDPEDIAIDLSHPDMLPALRELADCEEAWSGYPASLRTKIAKVLMDAK